jgi:hypothetical protein
MHGSPNVQRKRDQYKRDACTKNGITLIEVPFWWNQLPSSLAGTILKYCPDAMISNGVTVGTILSILVRFC